MKSALAAGVAMVAFALATELASAADMPTRAPAPIVKAPVHHDWTGWYGGFNYGNALSSTQNISSAGVIGSTDRAGDGFTVGLQAGYNWQYARHWVVGFEGDINLLGIDRTRQDWNDGRGFGVKTDWFGTLRGRWGYTSSPSLIYIHGGAAWTNYENNVSVGAAGRSSTTASGWTAGWGIETMLGGGWSTKSEYLYIDAGQNTVVDNGGLLTRYENAFHVFRTGYNYKLGAASAPLPARNWTGAYAGYFGGVAASQVNGQSPTFVGEFDVQDNSLTAGVQTGFNWQIAPKYLAGIEADIGWMGISRDRLNWNETVTFGTQADWYGTLRGRIGYNTGPAFIYFTGGGALVNLKNRVTLGASNSSSDLAGGWALGSGIEVDAGNGWTAKSEYIFIDVGNQNVTNPGFGTITTFENSFHIFRFGMNRKFGT